MKMRLHWRIACELNFVPGTQKYGAFTSDLQGSFSHSSIQEKFSASVVFRVQTSEIRSRQQTLFRPDFLKSHLRYRQPIDAPAGPRMASLKRASLPLSIPVPGDRKGESTPASQPVRQSCAICSKSASAILQTHIKIQGRRDIFANILQRRVARAPSKQPAKKKTTKSSRAESG